MATQFYLSDEEFRTAVEHAKQTREVIEELKRVSPDKIDYITKLVFERRESIEMQLEDDFSRMLSIHESVGRLEEKIRSSAKNLPAWLISIDRITTYIFIAIFILVPIYGIYSLFYGFNETTQKVVDASPTLAVIMMLFLAISPMLFFLIMGMRGYFLLEDTERQRKEMNIDSEINELKNSKSTLLERAADLAVGAWGGVINEHTKPAYSTEFQHTAVVGMDNAGVAGRNSQIRTEAHRTVSWIVDNWRGAAIGIAGPRGAGKSTLIRWFCEARLGSIGKVNVITVSVSAPVEYEPREFVLHLFSSLCHSAIERLDPSYNRIEITKRTAPSMVTNNEGWKLALKASRFAMRLGCVTLLAALLLALIIYQDTTTQNRSTIKENRLTATTGEEKGSENAGTTAIAVAPGTQELPERTSSTKNTGSVPASVQEAKPGLIVMSELFGVNPKTLLRYGLYLLTCSFAVLAVLLGKARNEESDRIDSADRKNKKHTLTWYNILFDDLFTLALETPVTAIFKDDLISTALYWLAEIKFQQSFTVGWSGALKMPFGAESSISEAKSMAKQQLSLPEIVDAYMRFVDKVAMRYKVLIGIDELDKIASVEKASKFLNDIKMVFGGFSVFYLVSVSDDAMSSFERRGLPFRDAFDSAFDEIVKVQNMELDQSRNLLAERFLGLPIQFQALCHVLSGGLARELLRTAKSLVSLNANANVGAVVGSGAPHSLAGIVSRWLISDVRNKCWAFGSAAEKIESDESRDDFLKTIQQISSITISARALRSERVRILRSEFSEKLPAVVVSPSDEQRKVRNLRLEFGTYIYFLELIAIVFTDSLDEKSFVIALENGIFDDLARCRRLQAFNQKGARDLLGVISTRWLKVSRSWNK